MILCKNGMYTPETVHELSWLLLWNLRSLREDRISWIYCKTSQGVYANCEGHVPARVRIGLTNMPSDYHLQIQKILIAPCLNTMYKETANGHVRVPESEYTGDEFGDPDKKSEVLFGDCEFENASLENKLDVGCDKINLTKTIEDFSIHCARVEKMLGKNFNLQVDGFTFRRGEVSIYFNGSLFNKEKNDDWLKTIPRGISISDSEGRKEYVLTIMAAFRYPSAEMSC